MWWSERGLGSGLQGPQQELELWLDLNSPGKSAVKATLRFGMPVLWFWQAHTKGVYFHCPLANTSPSGTELQRECTVLVFQEWGRLWGTRKRLRKSLWNNPHCWKRPTEPSGHILCFRSFCFERRTCTACHTWGCLSGMTMTQLEPAIRQIWLRSSSIYFTWTFSCWVLLELLAVSLKFFWLVSKLSH